MNLGCATGHPSFVMSNSLHEPGARAVGLWTETGKVSAGRPRLPKHLDEEVARLHLEQLGVKLTKLTPKRAGIPFEDSVGRAVQAGPLQDY